MEFYIIGQQIMSGNTSLLFIPKTSNKSMNHFSIDHFELNQTDFTFIRNQKSVQVFSFEPEGEHYIFNLIDKEANQFHAIGDTAIIIEPTGAGKVDSKNLIADIRRVILKFDYASLCTLLKMRFGPLFFSVPWRTNITESSAHLMLIRSLVLWIIQEKTKETPPLKSWLHIEKALLELFVDNLDRRIVPRFNDSVIQKKWFVELENWIDKNLTDPIVLNDLAKIAGVNVRTIQKAFREYRGCTPIDDINRRRMEKARVMLLETAANLTVLDVALEAGYQHPSRFAALYKKKYGENPSQTLARARKKSNRL
jgi:AraC-like DNA-binding protein